MSIIHSEMTWDPARPRVLVIACSDGRLQEPTDDFLGRQLGVTRYDRLYLPGGGGALAPSGPDFLRALQLRRECQFLVEAHAVEAVVLLFHAPAPDGPDEAMCADYRRKLPWATVAQMRAQQERDTRALLARRVEWAGSARVRAYRCEVTGAGGLVFVPLDSEPEPAGPLATLRRAVP